MRKNSSGTRKDSKDSTGRKDSKDTGKDSTGRKDSKDSNRDSNALATRKDSMATRTSTIKEGSEDEEEGEVKMYNEIKKHEEFIHIRRRNRRCSGY